MNRNTVKASVSTLMGLAFLAASLSGGALYLIPRGMIFGAARYIWYDAHAISALVAAVLAVLHFALNLRILRAEWRGARRKK